MLKAGKIVEPYEILEEIGSGGGGTVYKGYHKRLMKEVVIKKIHDEVKDIMNSRAEADILKNLRHEYLPQVFDFLQIDGNVYTVMDYIPGKSLQQLLDEGTRFTQRQVIGWAIQLANALKYLHGQNPPIIHSDIKPANIMLTPKGDICLIDFNISSVFDYTDTKPIGFSDGYSPPEQYPESVRIQKLSEYNKVFATPLSQKVKVGEVLTEFDKTEAFERTLPFDRSVNQEKSPLDEDKTEVFSREASDHADATELYQQEEAGKKSDAGKIILSTKDAKAQINERSDIYSFGATLYQLITGTKPSCSLT